MNAATTSPLGVDFPKQLVQLFINTMDEAAKQSARIIWSFAISFFVEHWLLIMGSFLVVLLLLILKAYLGEWGSLYSLTYNTLYVGVILVVGSIWGPEALVSDVFHIMYMVAIYPTCFLLTAWIWDRFGFRRKWR